MKTLSQLIPAAVKPFAILCSGLLVVSIAGCTIKDAGSGKSSSADGKLEGHINIDGSSTVFLISQAVSEEFGKQHPNVRAPVGESGTGGGFEKFSRGEIDVNDASRPIKDVEREACKKAGVEFVELKIAVDALSVVVHPDNDFCTALSVDQLKQIWESGSQISNWNQINPNWPDEEIKLYGPDTKSGTYDYFTKAICGKSGNSRSDYTPSTDDNILVQGVSGDKNSLAYFGYAYYVRNDDKLKVLGVARGDDVADAVKPNVATARDGSYKPLSRLLFLYVRKDALKRPEVAAYLNYYLGEEGQKLVAEVGYIQLSDEELAASRKTLKDALAAVEGGEKSADEPADGDE